MNPSVADMFEPTRGDLFVLACAAVSVVAMLLVAMTAAGEDWKARVADWFARDTVMPWPPEMDHEGPIHGLRADQLVDDGPDDVSATRCESTNPFDGEQCLLVAGHDADHVSSRLLALVHRRPVFADPVDPIKGDRCPIRDSEGRQCALRRHGGRVVCMPEPRGRVVHEITRGPDGRLRIIDGGKANG